MAALPVVAIVGRPNVGKSTLFNRLAGKRISIVQDEPGVTRDRIYANAEWCGHNFTIIDTGGLDLSSDDDIAKNIVKQADIAIAMADVILYVVDVKTGLLPQDIEVADRLRKSKKPIVLVCNKLDNYKEEELYEFYELNLGKPFGIAAAQGLGVGDALDEVVSHFGERKETDDPDAIKIAIIGKPNAGKSSLVNRLVGEERVIVSSVAGTTRDAIDVPFTNNKQKFVLIDTAGMRRKRSIEDETVERYSIFRTIDSVKRADVVVVVIDASVDLSEQDVKVCALAHNEEKPVVILMNKWDLIEKNNSTMQEFNKKLEIDLAFMNYFKPVYMSALTGKRVDKLMPAVLEVFENANKKITTGQLNDIIQNAYLVTPPSSKSGRKLKIYYGTQTGTCPPTFTLFINDQTLVSDNYL
ncbi:MAG: ribosome biogenesis GTPase Der, partial [Clostridia bacterium]|nr:ribosome biogenesis GTPase Der [Clostridia bacterium]